MGSSETSPPSVLATDASAPSIPLLRNIATFSGEKLSRAKQNYFTWVEDADLFLTINGLIGYVDGSITRPENDEPRAQKNWIANDKLTAAGLVTMVERSEQESIPRAQGAKACWHYLRLNYHRGGPIWQVNFLRDALSMSFSKSTPLAETAQKIGTAVGRAYAEANVNCDLMKCIIYLHALRDFPHIRTQISREISSSTFTNPVTSMSLLQFFDKEQSLIDSDRRQTAEPVNLTARNKQSSTTCSNCKRTDHLATYCIAPGGGMAGKSIEESRAARKRNRRGKKKKTGNTTQKAAYKLTGQDGRVYFTYLDPKEIIPVHWPGISANNNQLPDLVEYNGFMAQDDEQALPDAVSLRPCDIANMTLSASRLWMDTAQRLTSQMIETTSSPSRQSLHIQ